MPLFLSLGAGGGNRTRVNSLEGYGNEPLYDTRDFKGFLLQNFSEIIMKTQEHLEKTLATTFICID